MANYDDSDSVSDHHRRHQTSASYSDHRGFVESPSARLDNNNFSPSFPPSVSSATAGGGLKRAFSFSSNGTSPAPDYYADDWGSRPQLVKLYVGGVPRTATAEDIQYIFGEHGNVVEVVFIKSKWTGQQQECCFVKYATLVEADRAIVALNDRYTFPGGLAPVKVRYADGGKEGHGFFGQQLLKLYVGCVNKQATERDIEEIFSPFGVVEDVFIVRGEMRRHRGCAFVQFSRREMAVAAINALNGSYVMRGCEQPLIVRFADPKKPKCAGSRNTPYFGDQVAMVTNDFHPSSNKICKPYFVCASNSLECGMHSSCSSPCAVFSSSEPADSMDCEWSEHICPDGYPYYYNCVTFESRWEKPEEYAVYERQFLKLEQQPEHNSLLEVLSTTEVSQSS